MEADEFSAGETFYTPDLSLDIEHRSEDLSRHKQLIHEAALKGSWADAQVVLEMYPELLGKGITTLGDTALHVAAEAGHVDFVKGLVGLALRTGRSRELASVNIAGNTALHITAASGSREIIRELLQAGINMAMTRGKLGLTPLHVAALFGHEEAFTHLWRYTFPFLTDHERISLLIILIDTSFYDRVLKTVTVYPNLAAAQDEHGRTLLHVLAEKREQARVRNGSESSPDFYILLVQQLWRIATSDRGSTSCVISISSKPLFAAVETGNYKFVCALISSYPDLIWKFDENGRSIFHVAVQYRQEDIFRLIHQIGTVNKNLLVNCLDSENNSLLHLASMLPPKDRLKSIASLPVFQMQREEQWYKAVKDLMQPAIAKGRNVKGELARELFTKEHEELWKAGEKWIRKTATAGTVVAGLIATIAFQCLLQISGRGKEGSTGINTSSDYWPIIMCGSISLLSAAASVITFLSVLISRHAEDDFVLASPRTLMIGLTSTVLSLVALMEGLSVLVAILFRKRLWGSIAGAVFFSSVALVILRMPSLPRDLRKAQYKLHLMSKGPDNLF